MDAVGNVMGLLELLDSLEQEHHPGAPQWGIGPILGSCGGLHAGQVTGIRITLLSPEASWREFHRRRPDGHHLAAVEADVAGAL
jgi:hypothetical protein